MTKSTYNPYFFYISNLLRIIKIQIDNIFIIANNVFSYNKKKSIKVIKTIIKNCKYLIFAKHIKFNGTKINLDLDSIVLTKKSH